MSGKKIPQFFIFSNRHTVLGSQGLYLQTRLTKIKSEHNRPTLQAIASEQTPQMPIFKQKKKFKGWGQIF